MQMPAVQARVTELLRGGQDRDRAWCDAQWAMIGNRLAEADLGDKERANVQLQMTFLMNFARYKGWVVNKTQIDQRRATFDLGKLGAGELRAALDAMSASLSPAARKRVEAIAAGAPDVIDATSERGGPLTSSR